MFHFVKDKLIAIKYFANIPLHQLIYNHPSKKNPTIIKPLAAIDILGGTRKRRKVRKGKKISKRYI